MAELINSALMRIRVRAYRFGYRPKRSSLLYSPSLSMVYGFKDAMKGRRR